MKDIKMVKTVKAIANKYNSCYTIGKEYEVKKENLLGYDIDCDRGGGTFHSKEDFEVVAYHENKTPVEFINPTEEGAKELRLAADEREVLIQAFVKVTKEFEGRTWLTEGRGVYPYNDDRYKEEVKYILDAFNTIKKDTWKQIKSGTFEYKNRIITEFASINAPYINRELLLRNELINCYKYLIGQNIGQYNGINVQQRIDELKSGIYREEKEVEVKKPEEHGEYVNCPDCTCKSLHQDFSKFCPNCGSKINWK